MDQQETRRIHHAGHVIALASPYDYRVPRLYVDDVLNGEMSEDEFWTDMRRRFPILPLGPIRRVIEQGAITPAPVNTPTTSLIEGGWYWIKEDPDGEWMIAQVNDTSLETRFVRFTIPGREVGTYYDEIVSIGPMVPQYVPDQEDDGHDHGHDQACPLCPSQDVLDQMGHANRAREADRRREMLKEIEADPSAFVFVIEGYENVHDRSPVIMQIASTIEKAHRYLDSERIGADQVYEVTPHRVDSTRTGETVLFHVIMKDGMLVERDGRRQRS